MDTLSRTQFLSILGGGVIGTGLGTIYKNTRAPSPDPDHALLRPPGASANENEFLAKCTRCGQCVEACPYDTLHLADLSRGTSAGTPYFIAAQIPCSLCEGYDEPLCIKACPTDALAHVPTLEEITIGTAVINSELCWAYNGIMCRHCWHACPWPDIALQYDQMLQPVVNADACVGCGLCEQACPTEIKSITITPASIYKPTPLNNNNKVNSTTKGGDEG